MYGGIYDFQIKRARKKEDINDNGKGVYIGRSSGNTMVFVNGKKEIMARRFNETYWFKEGNLIINAMGSRLRTLRKNEKEYVMHLLQNRGLLK